MMYVQELLDGLRWMRRTDISWGKKFELDVWYVDHLSFWLDMKIIFLTIWKVLKRDGVSKEGMATTEPFNGYN